MHSAVSSSQEILLAGALICFHCYSSTSASAVKFSMVVFLLFSVGVNVFNIGNFTNLATSGTAIGFLFILLAMCGFVVLFANQMWLLYTSYDSSRFFSGPDASVYTAALGMNWGIRIIIYLVADGRSYSAKGHISQSMFIIVNVLTVLFISLLHSRQTKQEAGRIQVCCIPLHC